MSPSALGAAVRTEQLFALALNKLVAACRGDNSNLSWGTGGTEQGGKETLLSVLPLPAGEPGCQAGVQHGTVS